MSKVNERLIFSNGSRYSTARAYLRPASDRQNLHILLNAVASRVIVDPYTKKVTGVEYIKGGQKNVVGVNKEVGHEDITALLVYVIFNDRDILQSLHEISQKSCSNKL